MSKNSSPKKNSITSSDEYDRLSDLYREAYDAFNQAELALDGVVFIMS